MAQNQATGGNSMAATLGNLQNRTRQLGARPTANYGAGMQQPMLGGAGGARGPMQMGGAIDPYQMGGAIGPYGRPAQQQPIPPGGAGYPQMSPDAMQNMMGQLSAAQGKKPFNVAPGQPGQPMQAAPGNMLGGLTQGPASLGMAPGRRPRMPVGAPGMGAGGGKNQQIAQLPGGPGMMAR